MLCIVKLLRSEVSADVSGTLNFTLCDSTKLHYVVKHNFTSTKSVLHKIEYATLISKVYMNDKNTHTPSGYGCF